MKIALLELGTSHQECIYSQLLFLREAGHEVFLIHHRRFGSKKLYEKFQDSSDLPLTDFQPWNRIIYLKIDRLIRKWGIEAMIINTLENKQCRAYLHNRKFKNLRIAGILHNVHKKPLLDNSEVSRYYVLSNALLNKVNLQLKPHEKATYFYPSFLSSPSQKSIPKPPNELWICIPGQVEFARRDYVTLFEQLKNPLSPGVKIIFLGKSHHAQGVGTYLTDTIHQLGLEDQVTYFKDFVDESTFHTYMMLSDYILPLIHPSKKEYELYLDQKVSGAFNLAFAYQKTMLLEKAFENHADLTDVSLFYDLEQLVTRINELTKVRPVKYYTHEKWTFQAQQANYLSLLQSE